MPGISEVGSTAATVIATYRVNGIYRVDDNTIQVEFNHAMTQQPCRPICWCTIPTRAHCTMPPTSRASAAVKYNFGFNTANTLPALGSTFKGYYLAWRFDDGLPDESISPWAVEQGDHRRARHHRFQLFLRRSLVSFDWLLRHLLGSDWTGHPGHLWVHLHCYAQLPREWIHLYQKARPNLTPRFSSLINTKRFAPFF